MKKDKSDALIQKLVKNEISRDELDELLEGLEDEKIAQFLEASMKSYFEEIIKDFIKEIKKRKKDDSNVKTDKKFN